MPDQRQGNPEKQPLPGSVSDQNNEQGLPGNDDQPQTRRPPASSESSEGTSGESSEGTQSTGHPDSAG